MEGTWFEGEIDILCSMERVREELQQPAGLFLAATRNTAGITDATLVDATTDQVSIETNEGMMRRGTIVARTEADTALLAFDEVYETSKVTGESHHVLEFSAAGGGVRLRLVVSDVEAGGVLGFLYRKFGGANIGKALLAGYKAALEAP